MAQRPSGTSTFLFTDVEGSTRQWEQHPDEMRVALERHDEILLSVIERYGGYVFSTAGDSYGVAFARTDDAVAAAVSSQVSLSADPSVGAVPVRVRMGVHTGEAQERDGNYFGTAVNRAARVMSAANGGQVLVTESTAAMIEGVDLLDLGEHRLRDLSGATRLYQVRGEGLALDFEPLRTLNVVPGNLPEQVTSFVGREAEVTKVSELVRAGRMATITGTGGVGKTRLAVQAAAELADEFPDGAWLIELAPVGDPAAVPDAVATTLSITPRAGLSVGDTVAQALRGSRSLIVVDNCEHVLDAAADLIETILGQASTVKVLATSREGLGVDAEHLLPLAPLDVRAGSASAAVELFLDRARAVNPEFDWDDAKTTEAVTEICERLDGIALAIELAAARMASMSPADVRDRLSDRFRLLSGGRRGIERHQTLRKAVAWSYDLLSDEEKTLLNRCSVFSDGFDLAAAAHVCVGAEDVDEYEVLDLLDSLVRRSLVIVELTNGHTRYGLLETIRQFGEDQLATADAIQVRDRHAAYYAKKASEFWDMWNSSQQRIALDLVEVDYANLRTGFRWAADAGDLATAAAIAAHTTLTSHAIQRYESVGWAEEIVDAATAADITQLPRLFTAASLCIFTGRPEKAFDYTTPGLALEADPRYHPFETGWTLWMEGVAYLYTSRLDKWFDICETLNSKPGFAPVAGMCGLLFALPPAGRSEEAMEIAERTLTAARDLDNPYWLAHALDGYGRTFTELEPSRALTAFREGLEYARENRQLFWQAILARDAAGLEAIHGEYERALDLFDIAIDSFHRAGDHGSVGSAFAFLSVFFYQSGQPDTAATIYGASSHFGTISWTPNLPDVVEQMHNELGTGRFDHAAATGAAMELSDAVNYARSQIQAARRRTASA